MQQDLYSMEMISGIKDGVQTNLNTIFSSLVGQMFTLCLSLIRLSPARS